MMSSIGAALTEAPISLDRFIPIGGTHAASSVRQAVFWEMENEPCLKQNDCWSSYSAKNNDDHTVHYTVFTGQCTVSALWYSSLKEFMSSFPLGNSHSAKDKKPLWFGDPPAHYGQTFSGQHFSKTNQTFLGRNLFILLTFMKHRHYIKLAKFISWPDTNRAIGCF